MDMQMPCWARWSDTIMVSKYTMGYGIGEAGKGLCAIERDGSEEAKAVHIRVMWEAYLAPGDVVPSGPKLLPRTMSEPVALL